MFRVACHPSRALLIAGFPVVAVRFLAEGLSVAVVESFHNSGRITLAAWKGFQPSMGLVIGQGFKDSDFELII